MLIALSLLSTIESAKVYNTKTMTNFLYEMRLQDITSWTGYLFRWLQLLWLPMFFKYQRKALRLADITLLRTCITKESKLRHEKGAADNWKGWESVGWPAFNERKAMKLPAPADLWEQGLKSRERSREISEHPRVIQGGRSEFTRGPRILEDLPHYS